MNNQNLFIAMVLDRKAASGLKRRAEGGALRIDGGFAFPLPFNSCIGSSVDANLSYTNVSPGHTPYFFQRSTLVLQGNVRNRPFYQPYIHSKIGSSLTTRSAPTYLHEQPYLFAFVADFTHIFSDLKYWYIPTWFGIVHPGYYYNESEYTHRLFVLGMMPHFPGKFIVDHGWGGTAAYDYDIPLNSKAVYLVWRKNKTAPPMATINGKLQEIYAANPSTGQFYQDYLKVFTDRINMLAMGDHHYGGMQRSAGSIYEAMVLTWPKIQYGHQRLIEGYLAWKWGLQHLLPRSHSYRRVPPAR
jgi:hypothetical protein